MEETADPVEEVRGIAWEAQTGQPTDPPAVVLEITIRIGDVERIVKGTFDTGADMTELEPPAVDEFGVNEDECGFVQIEPEKNRLDTEPVVMAEATFGGHSFPMPVVLLKYSRRNPQGKPINVFGRAGLLDHFHVDLDPLAATTSFTWTGLAPNARLAEIKHHFIDERRGKAKQHQGIKAP